MSCVREASPPLADGHLRRDMKKRRFLQPLRGLRRIFRKKGRASVVSATSSDGHAGVNGLRASNENLDLSEQMIDSNLEPAKSHSTSHLDDDQTDNAHRSCLQSTTLLSVSHDSVFTSEQRSPNSGSETSLYVARTGRLGFPHSSVRAELFEAVRSRRRAQENNVSDDEDLGLPRSPVSNSPTTADDMFTKEHNVTKSSQSTCSDGSLLSMGSSEIDEESYCHSSRHSSKLSLYEKRMSTGSDLQHNDRSTNSSSGGDAAASLSHSAAKHKMAVKPKRNHGAPHKKRQLITSNTLPTTPELNEESNTKNSAVIVATNAANGKDTSSKPVADSGQCDKHLLNQNHSCKTPLRTEHHTSVTQITSAASKRYADHSINQSKYCSLPPVVSLSPAPSFKLLARSKSNVTASPSNAANANAVTATFEDVIDEKECSKKEDGTSFFSRLLLRRSSKKKKSASEESSSPVRDDSPHEASVPATRSWPTSPDDHVSLSCLKEEPTSMAYVNGGLAMAMKHHPLFRQRVEPLNLPAPQEDSSACTKISYSSTVPVNMSDCSQPLSMVVDVNSSKCSVQKSHSFRNSDKLPYGVCEDTPSLPVNVGLIDEDVMAPVSAPTVIAVAEEVPPKRYSRASSDGASDSEREKLKMTVVDSVVSVSEPMTPVVEMAPFITPVRWKPSPPKSSPPKSSPDYENLAAVSKLSISVNEGVNVTMPVIEAVTEAKPVVAQIPQDVRIPVPAPRISLMNRTPPHSLAMERSSSGSSSCSLSNHDSINVTVTESADGQRSIISIGSNDCVVTAADLLEAAAAADMVDQSIGPRLEDAVSKADELEDDVFQSQTESPASVDDSPLLPYSLVIDEVTRRLSETDDDTWTNYPGNKESSSAHDVPEEVAEMVSVTSEEVEISEAEVAPQPPVVVVDLNAGIVKVNDTTVVIRKKTPQPKKDEEPELMKVFARRSLKLKETDCVAEALYDGAHKSRDSDKENEDSNAAEVVDEQQPRKKKSEAPDAVIAAVPPKPPAAFGRFQRSVSHDVEKNVLANSQTNHVNDKRQRCKSTSMIVNEGEKRERVPSSPVEEKNVLSAAPCDEKPAMPFKRIQQRREEWEKRAQQAMKVHGTK